MKPISEATFSIWRYSFGQERELVEAHVSLEEAQAHCQREDTHGRDAYGTPWFDGYLED